MSAVVPFYIKTAYHDEPSFTNTKVVTSLFPKTLKDDLNPNFKRCLEFRDATAELLKPYKDQFDFDELCKLAIDYSDGIIEGIKGVKKDLLTYASEKDIPVIHSTEDIFDQIEALYNTICPESATDSEDE